MIALRPPLILASQSPRRRALLRQIGLSFEVYPSHVDEVLPEGVPLSVAVEHLAQAKAEAVATRFPDALTLGADTIVVLEGDVLGKPANSEDAICMLHRLSGRTHTVYTGLALLHPRSGRAVTASEATEVTFARLSASEVTAYVATGSPLDKAGGYGIQDDLGSLFVEGVNGDYYNVVGLPLHRLYRLLKESFEDLLC